jgi:hypothetical protein
MTSKSKAIVNVRAPQHARIDRRTSRITLPVPSEGYGATFSISGAWRDLPVDGPDATVVVVNCCLPKASRNSSHRLTKDASFKLPYGTLQLEIDVVHPADCADLLVRVVACNDDVPTRLPSPASYRNSRGRSSAHRAFPVRMNDVFPPSTTAS